MAGLELKAVSVVACGNDRDRRCHITNQFVFSALELHINLLSFHGLFKNHQETGTVKFFRADFGDRGQAEKEIFMRDSRCLEVRKPIVSMCSCSLRAIESLS